VALLAELATRIAKLREETTGTEALGVILKHPAAAAAFMAAVRAGAPAVPRVAEFTTQVASDEGRPDVVGRDSRREVVFVEGKYWFGFTPAQETGSYLRRLEDAWRKKASDDAHVGALVFVVPPRRVTEVITKVSGFYQLSDARTVGEWQFANAPNGVVVAVCSWQQLLASIMATGTEEVIADCRQLLGLVDDIDRHAFVPWSEGQLSDQDTPKRVFQLVSLITHVRQQALMDGVATHTGARQTSKYGDLAYGKIFTLGGVPAILAISPYLWSEYGDGPVWLRFKAGSAVARAAFGNACRRTGNGVAVSVPIAADQSERDVVTAMVTTLASMATRLQEARQREAAPPLVDDFGDDEDDA
jgi:hypothetical protein